MNQLKTRRRRKVLGEKREKKKMYRWKRWMDQSQRWKQRTNASPLYFIFPFFFSSEWYYPSNFFFIFFHSLNKERKKNSLFLTWGGKKKISERILSKKKINKRKQFIFVFSSKDGQTVWPRLSIFRTVDTRNRADPFRVLSFRHWYSSSSGSRILCAVFILGLLSAPWIWRLIRLYWTDFYRSCVWPPCSPIPSNLMGFPSTIGENLSKTRKRPRAGTFFNWLSCRWQTEKEKIYIYI